MRVWKQRAGRALLGLIGGLGSLVAWQMAAFAVCSGNATCPAPPSGCSLRGVYDFYGCSTDGNSCCAYIMTRYDYWGPGCGGSSTCVARSLISSHSSAVCSNGFCVSRSSSSSSSAAALHAADRA